MRLPKDDKYYHWTSHSKHKMLQYQISESLVKRIIRSPKRVEEGIAPKTFAVMQSKTNTKKPSEIWVMYAVADFRDKILDIGNYKKKIIISAWKYPGITKPGKKLSIPLDTLEELQKIVNKWM